MQAFEAVEFILMFYSSWTLLVYASVIRAMIHERKQANIVFYAIYMVSLSQIFYLKLLNQAGSVADVISLINVVLTYCSLTHFLQLRILRTQIALRVRIYLHVQNAANYLDLAYQYLGCSLQSTAYCTSHRTESSHRYSLQLTP